MSKSRYSILSTVGRKILLAITGLCLLGFIVVHLIGNLLLLVSPDAFNTYAHKLISLGPMLYVAEGILLAIFLIHMVTAIAVTWGNWKARPGGYKLSKDQGDPSRMTFSSKTMIWTGLVLLVFLIVHLITFKYGPGMAEGYVAQIDGEPVRDLHRLVVEWFSNGIYVAYYVISMGLLGFHLRHGFWSAFQSLGGFHPRLTPLAYALGVFAGIVLAAGFLGLPVWFYLGGGTLS
jgi:succinate dehydrogenase / fumarate reductase cytochrome b subunit